LLNICSFNLLRFKVLKRLSVTYTVTDRLALPRVYLVSDTVRLIVGVANTTGLLVYNTTGTLGAGTFYWNGSKWVPAGLPSTTAADSGKFLMSNGSAWLKNTLNMHNIGVQDTLGINFSADVAFKKLIDSTLVISREVPWNSYFQVFSRQAIPAGALCFANSSARWELSVYLPPSNSYLMSIVPVTTGNLPAGSSVRIRCYMPSL